MTYNVFGGTLSLTQSINQSYHTVSRVTMWFGANAMVLINAVARL